LMYIYMGHMRYEDTQPYENWFWQKNRIELIRGFVTSIDTSSQNVKLENGTVLRYDSLILATGSISNRSPWPGGNLDGVQGLYGLEDLGRMVEDTRDCTSAVVVGGGLIGIELAEMLRSRDVRVTFLVREHSYMDYVLPPEESRLVNEEIRGHHVDLRLATEVDCFIGDGGRVKSVRTSGGSEFECDFVGVAIGVSPNIAVAKDSGIRTEQGIVVNEFFETAVPSIYAIGDCAEFAASGIGHREVEQLWYSGRRQGETVARTICGDRTPYDRGIFFNSAKFFNLEYQTYGDVPTTFESGLTSIVWQHPDERKLIRIAYEKDTGAVRGFNVLGIRFRQSVCENWILNRVPIETVVSSLAKANFDPEFSPRYEHFLQVAG
ncbi:MAG: FAD-dependent oxidoreductase, partial [Rhodothermales bacterium]|nr:FAD-dependent oxidoreductase [Rhodothermales bacterium]